MELVLEAVPELPAKYFNERRETGVINIGAAGRVVVDGSEYVLETRECLLETRECLYIGMGAHEIRFQSGESVPAVYYLLSCPRTDSFRRSSSRMQTPRLSRPVTSATPPGGELCDTFMRTVSRAASS